VVTPLTPFIHAGEKAATFYEAKSDWEICALMAKKIDERAASRGITEFKDRAGRSRSFAGLYEQFSSKGEFGPTDDDKVARFMVENASNLEGVRWDDSRRRVGPASPASATASCRSATPPRSSRTTRSPR